MNLRLHGRFHHHRRLRLLALFRVLPAYLRHVIVDGSHFNSIQFFSLLDHLLYVKVVLV